METTVNKSKKYFTSIPKKATHIRADSPRRGTSEVRVLRVKKYISGYDFAGTEERQRNSSNNIVEHLIEKYKRPLTSNQENVATYLAKLSDHIYRTEEIDLYTGQKDFFKNGCDINGFYVSLVLQSSSESAKEKKKTFDDIKAYLADKSCDYFIEKGWLDPKKDSVIDVFSGIDCAFAKAVQKIQVKGTNNLTENRVNLPEIVSLDETFKICNSSPEFKNMILEEKYKDFLLSNDDFISGRLDNNKSKKDFIHMAAPPILGLLEENRTQEDYNNFINNILLLSKIGTHIVIGFHANSAVCHEQMGKLNQKLQQDSHFEHEVFDAQGECLIADSFIKIIHLVVKDTEDKKKPASKKLQKEKPKDKNQFTGLKKGFLK